MEIISVHNKNIHPVISITRVSLINVDKIYNKYFQRNVYGFLALCVCETTAHSEGWVSWLLIAYTTYSPKWLRLTVDD